MQFLRQCLRCQVWHLHRCLQWPQTPRLMKKTSIICCNPFQSTIHCVFDPEHLYSGNISYDCCWKPTGSLDSWTALWVRHHSQLFGELLPTSTGSTIAYQIWSKASRLFATASDVKVACLKHELHSIRKGDQSIAEYLAHVKRLCDVLSV